MITLDTVKIATDILATDVLQVTDVSFAAPQYAMWRGEG